MLKLNAKYEQLKGMLNENGYNVSGFHELDYLEYFLLDTGSQHFSISVSQDEETNSLEVVVEEEIDEVWFIVERKYYKNVKSAYTFIEKVLNY